MRKITETEQKKITSKLSKIFDISNSSFLKEKNLYYHNKNIFIIPPNIYKNISTFPKNKIKFCGKHLGKFTRSENFYLKISCLNLLKDFINKKIWIKYSAENNFLYGNNVLKSHVFKVSENINKNEIVFLFNQNDLLLGFGITTRNYCDFEKADHNSTYVIRQCDKGEFLRDEQRII